MGNRFRRLAITGLVVAVVAAGAGTAYAARSSSGPSYRLASAVPAVVTANLAEVGTLAPVHQADVSFAVTGTVQTVAVQAGQHVAAGQKLGTLDAAPLQAALTAAQSTLANANLQVHNDLASEDAAAGGSGASPAPSGSSGSSPASQLIASLRPLQQAVLSAQRQADGALARATTALARARQACAARPSPTPTPSPSPGSTPSPSPSPTSPAPSPSPTSPAPSPSPTLATPSPSPTPTGTAVPVPAGTGTAPASGPAPVTCIEATQRVLAAETAAWQAQETLSGRLTALADALARAIATAGTSSSGGGDGGGGGGTGGDGGGTRASGTGGDGGGTRASGTGGDGGGTRASGTGGSGGGAVSAAQLAADQASADAAAAQVTVAQLNLAAATLVSPISGTVVTVSATPGTAETAGDVAFEIAGLDSYQVVAQVPVTDMPQLKVGQSASVLPDGASVPVSGSVVSIGLIPDSTGSPTTYPVTIGLAGQPSGLHPDGYASVTITTARSSGVSVPTSAVRKSGGKATVIVYAGGKTRVAKVTIGTMGPVMTRVTAGLRAGQQVVLANLSQPLPNNNPANQGPGGPGFAGTVVSGGGGVNFAPGPG
jgi:trimeric autotransporter adhesin